MNISVRFFSNSIASDSLHDCCYVAQGPEAPVSSCAQSLGAQIHEARHRPRQFHPTVIRALKAPARPNKYTNPEISDDLCPFDRYKLSEQGYYGLQDRIDEDFKLLGESKNLDKQKEILYKLLLALNRKRSIFPGDRQVAEEIQKVLSYLYGAHLGVAPPEEWDQRANVESSDVDMECYYAFMQEVFFSCITFPCVTPWQLTVLTRMIVLRTGDDLGDLSYLQRRLLPLFVGLPPRVNDENSESAMRKFLGFARGFLENHYRKPVEHHLL